MLRSALQLAQRNQRLALIDLRAARAAGDLEGARAANEAAERHAKNYAWGADILEHVQQAKTGKAARKLIERAAEIGAPGDA